MSVYRGCFHKCREDIELKRKEVLLEKRKSKKKRNRNQRESRINKENQLCRTFKG